MLPIFVLREIALACSYPELCRFRLAIYPVAGDVADLHFWKSKYHRDFPTDRMAEILLRSVNYYTQHSLCYRSLYRLCYDMKGFWSLQEKGARRECELFFNDIRQKKSLAFHVHQGMGKGFLPGFSLFFVRQLPPFELVPFMDRTNVLCLDFEIELSIYRWIGYDDRITYCVRPLRYSHEKLLMPGDYDQDLNGLITGTHTNVAGGPCLSGFDCWYDSVRGVLDFIYNLEAEGYRSVSHNAFISKKLVDRHQQYFIMRPKGQSSDSDEDSDDT